MRGKRKSILNHSDERVGNRELKAVNAVKNEESLESKKLAQISHTVKENAVSKREDTLTVHGHRVPPPTGPTFFLFLFFPYAYCPFPKNK